MFGNKPGKDNGKTNSVMPSPTSHALNSLVQGTEVQGDIRSKSDIRIDGKLKGSLHCDAKLIIGTTGKVEGSVHCKNAVIEGNFEGDLHVTELLTMKETAKVEGNISYGKLVVQPGAVLVGDVRMGGSNNNGSAKSKAKAQTSSSNNSHGQAKQEIR